MADDDGLFFALMGVRTKALKEALGRFGLDVVCIEKREIVTAVKAAVEAEHGACPAAEGLSAAAASLASRGDCGAALMDWEASFAMAALCPICRFRGVHVKFGSKALIAAAQTCRAAMPAEEWDPLAHTFGGALRGVKASEDMVPPETDASEVLRYGHGPASPSV